jgi:hypothetical protein
MRNILLCTLMAVLLVGCSPKEMGNPKSVSLKSTGIENLHEAKAAATYRGNGIASKSSSGTSSLCLIYDNNEIHLPEYKIEFHAEGLSEEEKEELQKYLVYEPCGCFLLDLGEYVYIQILIAYDFDIPYVLDFPLTFITPDDVELLIRKSDGAVIFPGEYMTDFFTAYRRGFAVCVGESIYVFAGNNGNSDHGIRKITVREGGCVSEFYSFSAQPYLYGGRSLCITADQLGNVYATLPLESGSRLLTISPDGESQIQDYDYACVVEYEGDVYLFSTEGVMNLSDGSWLLQGYYMSVHECNRFQFVSYKDGVLAFIEDTGSRVVKFDINDPHYSEEYIGGTDLQELWRRYNSTWPKPVCRKYKGNVYLLEDCNDHVEVKKVNFVDNSIETFRRVDAPSGQALRGYRFSLLGAPVLTLNFEEVTMTLKLDSESSEGDLVVESGELEDVVMLK